MGKGQRADPLVAHSEISLRPLPIPTEPRSGPVCSRCSGNREDSAGSGSVAIFAGKLPTADGFSVYRSAEGRSLSILAGSQL